VAINKDLKSHLKTIEALRADLKKAEQNAAKHIMELLKSFMKDHPQIEGFRWQQYTPGFNDGDVCEFGIHGPYFKFSEEIMERRDEDGNEIEEYDQWVYGGLLGDIDDKFFDEKIDIMNHKEMAPFKKAVKDATKLFTHLSSMEIELQGLFGDGYEITVTSKGVEVESYDHD
jgi:hypothetical protein